MPFGRSESGKIRVVVLLTIRLKIECEPGHLHVFGLQPYRLSFILELKCEGEEWPIDFVAPRRLWLLDLETTSGRVVYAE